MQLLSCRNQVMVGAGVQLAIGGKEIHWVNEMNNLNPQKEGEFRSLSVNIIIGD